MSISGGIQGLHFVNTMSNADLKRKSAEAEGIIGGMGRNISKLAPFAPLAAASIIFAKISDDAYDFSNDFSMAMREVETISEAAQDNFKGISNDIIELSKKGPDGAIELAKAFYQIVSAGHDGAKGLNLLDVASRAATAGLSSTETAADGLTSVLNAWGLDAEYATEVADVMFKTVERGKTTFSELASNIASVAPLAAANNISFDEIFGSVQTITKQGTSTSEAVTQIRSAIIGMNDVLGDGWSNTMTFQEGLQAVRDMAKGSQTELKNLMGRVEGVNGLLAMTGKNAKMAADDLASLGDNAKGASDKAYGIMADTATNQWKMAMNNINALMSGWGDELVDRSKGIAKAINAMFAENTGIEKVVSDLYQAKTEMNTLFSVLNNAAEGTERRTAAIKTINDKYSGYLSNLLSEKSTLEDIALAQKEATNAMIASVAVKSADQEIAQKMGEYQAKEKKLLEDMVAYVSEVRGPATATYFIEDLQKGIEQALKENPYNVWRSIYDNWVKQYDPGSMKFGDFSKDFMGAVKERFDLNQETAGINSWVRQYREMIAELDSDSKTSEKGGKGLGKTTTQKARNEDEEDYLNILRQIQLREEALHELTQVTDFPSDEAKNANLKDRLQLLKEISAIEEMRDGFYEKQKIKPVSPLRLSTKPNAQLQPMKQLTAEEQKRLEVQSKQLDKLHEQKELYESISTELEGASEILNAISFAAGEVDRELGESIGKMAALTKNAAGLMANIGPGGNPLSAVTSGIGIIGNIFSLFKNDGSEAAGKEMDRINTSIARTNQLLDYQLNLLSDLDGASWFAGAAKQLDVLESKLNSTKKRLNEINVHIKGQGRLGTVDTSNWTPEDWLKAVEHGQYSFGGMDESVNSMLDQWIQIAAQIENIKSEQQFRALGFNGDDVASNIAGGIADGLKLSENGLGGFSEMFGDLMRSALTQSIISGLNEKHLAEFMGSFERAMADNVISETEREQMQEYLRQGIEWGQKQWEIASPILDGYSSAGQTGIQGITRSLTEDTGSILAGLGYSIRENIAELNMGFDEMNSTMSGQLAIAEDSLEVLEDIRENTSHNARLIEIENELVSMNKNIKAGLGV